MLPHNQSFVLRSYSRKNLNFVMQEVWLHFDEVVVNCIEEIRLCLKREVRNCLRLFSELSFTVSRKSEKIERVLTLVVVSSLDDSH